MEAYVTEILLVVIALEGGYIGWRLRKDFEPRWQEARADGTFTGPLPKSHECHSLGSLVGYMACAMRVQMESEQVRFGITTAALDDIKARLTASPGPDDS